jgi:aromatic ring-cleaving dioxygenase
VSDTPSPVGTGRIRSYHAHVYFRSPDERVRAMQDRSWTEERFAVQQ